MCTGKIQSLHSYLDYQVCLHKFSIIHPRNEAVPSLVNTRSILSPPMTTQYTFLEASSYGKITTCMSKV